MGDVPIDSIFQREVIVDGVKDWSDLNIKIKTPNDREMVECVNLKNHFYHEYPADTMVFVHDYTLNIETKIL